MIPLQEDRRKESYAHAAIAIRLMNF